MTSDVDIACMLADRWNDGHAETARDVDFWPCCRLLAEAGLVRAQEEDLAAVSLGPFRIATTKSSAATVDFVEALVPSIIASIPVGESVVGAVSGLLSSACVCFVKLLNRGVVFSRSEQDRLRWSVLLYIRECNRIGEQPMRAKVVNAFPDQPVSNVLDWLMSGLRPVTHSGVVTLVHETGDGGLETTV